MQFTLPSVVSVGVFNGQTAFKNRAATKERRVSLFEIELPREEGGMSYVDGREAAVLPLRVICAKPGQVRKTRLPFKCYYVHMLLSEGALYEALMKTPTFIDITDKEKYLSLFRRLCRYYESDLAEDAIAVEGLLLELIHACIKDAGRQERPKGKEGGFAVINEVISYVKEKTMKKK